MENTEISGWYWVVLASDKRGEANWEPVNIFSTKEKAAHWVATKGDHKSYNYKLRQACMYKKVG